MTEKVYVCGQCQSKLESFDKDEGITIIYNCQYCAENELRLAQLCNSKLEAINTNKRSTSGVSLRDFVEGLGKAQQAILRVKP